MPASSMLCSRRKQAPPLSSCAFHTNKINVVFIRPFKNHVDFRYTPSKKILWLDFCCNSTSQAPPPRTLRRERKE
jgi:hypothetical protein